MWLVLTGTLITKNLSLDNPLTWYAGSKYIEMLALSPGASTPALGRTLNFWGAFVFNYEQNFKWIRIKLHLLIHKYLIRYVLLGIRVFDLQNTDVFIAILSEAEEGRRGDAQNTTIYDDSKIALIIMANELIFMISYRRPSPYPKTRCCHSFGHHALPQSAPETPNAPR